MLGGNQDNRAPRRKSSPEKDPAEYEGTPYSKGGPRKFVSRAERRRSAEGPLDDLPYAVMDPPSHVSEKTAPFPSAPAEPVNVSTSAETSQEQTQPVSSMSYSAVLKNTSLEASKSGPVTAKPVNQSKTYSRPPPGFAARPTHGGDTTMHMTVLSAKPKSRPSLTTSNTPRNTPATRADASMNWRSDERENQGQGSAGQQQQQPQHQQQQRQSGHAVKWRRFDEFVQSKPQRTDPSNEGGQRRDMPIGAAGHGSSDESPEPPPVVQPHRAFGPGGLKACVICGSKEHLRCNDRSKMFLD